MESIPTSRDHLLFLTASETPILDLQPGHKVGPFSDNQVQENMFPRGDSFRRAGFYEGKSYNFHAHRDAPIRGNYISDIGFRRFVRLIAFVILETGEYANFENALRKVLSVPCSEVKAKIDAEKQAWTQQKKQLPSTGVSWVVCRMGQRSGHYRTTMGAAACMRSAFNKTAQIRNALLCQKPACKLRLQPLLENNLMPKSGANRGNE